MFKKWESQGLKFTVTGLNNMPQDFIKCQGWVQKKKNENKVSLDHFFSKIWIKLAQSNLWQSYNLYEIWLWTIIYGFSTVSKRIFHKFVYQSLYRVTVVSMVTTWCWWFTNIFKLSPTHCVSNSSHRNRCNHFKALNIMKSISFQHCQIELFNISGLFFNFF